MPESYTATRNMPLDVIPARRRALSEEALERHDVRGRRASTARAKLVESAARDARRERRGLLGARNAAALRAAMREENAALREAREPPEGLTLDLDRAQRARKARVASSLRGMGVEPRQLRDAARSGARELREELADPGGGVTPGRNLAHDLARWLDLSPLHGLPLDWGVRPPVAPLDPTGWQVFGPEFPFWNRAFSVVESDGFVVTRDDVIDERFGFVAGVVTMRCDDAGEFDLSEGILDAEVVFIYEAPADGRVEVLVDATNARGHHELRLDNEFGFSEHWTYQRNYLTLNVFHPAVTERSLAAMSAFHKDGVEGTWREPTLTPGAHYYGHMLSNGVVRQGDTFFVGVGTRSFDTSRANDVGVFSQSDFQWLIRTVEVRIRP